MKDSFNDLSYGELLTRREEVREQYREARFNMVVGHIDNPLLLRTLKRKLARLNTIVHEYDLSIRRARSAAAAAGSGEPEQSAAAVEAKE